MDRVKFMGFRHCVGRRWGHYSSCEGMGSTFHVYAVGLFEVCWMTFS